MNVDLRILRYDPEPPLVALAEGTPSAGAAQARLLLEWHQARLPLERPN
jgi:hypothetical protein